MDRNSFSNLKQALLGLLFLQALVGIVNDCIPMKNVERSWVFFFIGPFVYFFVFGIQLVVYVENLNAVVAWLVVKLLQIGMEAVLIISLMLTNGPFSTYYGYYYYIGLHVWARILDLIVAGVMVAFLVSLRAIRQLSTSSGNQSDTPPNTRTARSLPTVNINVDSETTKILKF